MSVNNKQKSPCQMAFSVGKQQKNDRSVLGSNVLEQWFFKISNPAEPNFLAWWSLAAQEEDRFQDSKELENNQRVTMSQE